MVDSIKAAKPNSNLPCESSKHSPAQLLAALHLHASSVSGLLLHNFPSVLLSVFAGTATDGPGRADLCLEADSKAPLTDNVFASGMKDWTEGSLPARSENSALDYVIN